MTMTIRIIPHTSQYSGWVAKCKVLSAVKIHGK